MPVLTKKRLVLLALPLALVLIPLLVLVWNLFPIHRELPAEVTVAAVETSYPDLLDRLATAGPGGAGTGALDIDKDRDLVAPPEILEAKVGRNNGYTVIGNKTLRYRSKTGAFTYPPIGKPAIEKCWYTLEDGRKVVVAAFQAMVLDRSGQEWLLVILFDLDAFEKRLKSQP